MSLLSGCATTVYKTEIEVYCPPIIEYAREFNDQLITEIESLPETDGSIAVVDALSDYAALRDKLRKCAETAEQIKSK
jgi:hypothetical protein